MTRTAALLSLSLSLTACGTVAEPTDLDTPGDADIANPNEPAIDGSETPHPIMIEAPQAATGPSSLFEMTFSTRPTLEDVVGTSAGTKLDVVEQRFVTQTDQEVRLVIELAEPTGTYSRTIASDVIQGPNLLTDYVLCVSFDINLGDPRCNNKRPATSQRASEGTLAAARWSVAVVNVASNALVGTCVAAGERTIECLLPGKAAESYRVVASVNGFADVWDGSAGFGAQTSGQAAFTGAWAPAVESFCWEWYTSGGGTYCRGRYDYRRFNALDEAQLELDPITLTITANGRVTSMASPALTWDSGNDNLPGDTY